VKGKKRRNGNTVICSSILAGGGWEEASGTITLHNCGRGRGDGIGRRPVGLFGSE